MVKAAYSSGTPAIGVGAGNGPAYIHPSADVRLAVKHILDSKTFDNGTICASEQSIVVERAMEGAVTAELRAQGAYLLDDGERGKALPLHPPAQRHHEPGHRGPQRGGGGQAGGPGQGAPHRPGAGGPGGPGWARATPTPARSWA